jgi:hypothetical protein
MEGVDSQEERLLEKNERADLHNLLPLLFIIKIA